MIVYSTKDPQNSIKYDALLHIGQMQSNFDHNVCVYHIENKEITELKGFPDPQGRPVYNGTHPQA